MEPSSVFQPSTSVSTISQIHPAKNSKIKSLWQKVCRAVGNFFKTVFCCGCFTSKGKKIDNAVQILNHRRGIEEQAASSELIEEESESEIDREESLDDTLPNIRKIKAPIDHLVNVRVGEQGDDTLEDMRRWVHRFARTMVNETMWDQVPEQEEEERVQEFRGIHPELEEIQEKVHDAVEDFEENYQKIQLIRDNLTQLAERLVPNNGINIIDDLPIFVIISQTVLHRLLNHYEDVCQDQVRFLADHNPGARNRDRDAIRDFLNAYREYKERNDNPAVVLQEELLQDIRKLADEGQITYERFRSIEEKIPRVLEWLLKTTDEFDPEKFSDFIMALGKLADSGMALLGEDQEFKAEVNDLNDQIIDLAQGFIQQNVKLVDLPIRRVLVAAQHSDFQETFEEVFRYTYAHTEAYKAAKQEYDRKHANLDRRIQSKEVEIQRAYDQKLSAIRQLRAALDRGENLENHDVQQLLAGADAFENDELFVKSLIWLDFGGDEQESISVMAKRIVYEELKERYESTNDHYSVLFNREFDDRDDISFEQWLDRQFQSWINRQFLDTFANHPSTEANVKEMILLSADKSYQELKDELLDEWTDKVYTLLLPPFDRDDNGKNVDGLYQLLDMMNIPAALKDRLEGLFDRLVEHSQLDQDQNFDQFENFKEYAKLIGEEATVEFLQGEIKKHLRIGIDKIITLMTDPAELEVMIADYILPSVNDLFLQALTIQTLTRHIGDVKGDFQRLIYEDPANRRQIAHHKAEIIRTLIAKFREDERDYHLTEEDEEKVIEFIKTTIISPLARHLDSKKPRGAAQPLTERQVAHEIKEYLKAEEREPNPVLGNVVMNLVDMGEFLHGFRRGVAELGIVRNQIKNAFSDILTKVLFDVTKDHRKIFEAANLGLKPLEEKDAQVNLFFPTELTQDEKDEKAEEVTRRRHERVDALGKMLNHLTHYVVTDASIIARRVYNPTPSSANFTAGINKIFEDVFLKYPDVNRSLVLNVAALGEQMIVQGTIRAQAEEADLLRERIIEQVA